MLKLYDVPFAGDQEKYLSGLLNEILRKGHNAILLVPEQFSYENEQFYVHAEVRKSDGTVIATAHTDAGPASDGWTRYEMPFTYSDSTSETASIFITFRSTSSSSPKVRKMTIQEIGGSYTIHGGSILCVDDLQLIYE